MKLLCFYLLILLFAPGIDPIRSASYPWKAGKLIFSGSGAVLTDHQLKGIVLKKDGVAGFKPSESEKFYIVKSGPVVVELAGKNYEVDKGSVIFLLPGDDMRIRNVSPAEAEIYEMVYRSVSPDRERGRGAGSSFVINWNDMVFKPHDKGGVRQLFDRKTVMLNRFDIHITTLNPGLKSHEPHTHKNEEIILMLDGNAQMTVDKGMVGCNTGDAVYVASMVPHNLVNTGKKEAIYYAIQWN